MRSDILGWAPHMAPQGRMVLDDVQIPEVARAVRDAMEVLRIPAHRLRPISCEMAYFEAP